MRIKTKMSESLRRNDASNNDKKETKSYQT
jgi:hypothetical protein